MSSDMPSPHRFSSVALKSGVWDNKSMKELISLRTKLIDEHSKDLEQYTSASTELKSLMKAKELDEMLTDKSLNSDMNRIMKFFDSFFDEDSGNTREEGIKEVQKFL